MLLSKRKNVFIYIIFFVLLSFGTLIFLTTFVLAAFPLQLTATKGTTAHPNSYVINWSTWNCQINNYGHADEIYYSIDNQETWTQIDDEWASDLTSCGPRGRIYSEMLPQGTFDVYIRAYDIDYDYEEIVMVEDMPGQPDYIDISITENSDSLTVSATNRQGDTGYLIPSSIEYSIDNGNWQILETTGTDTITGDLPATAIPTGGADIRFRAYDQTYNSIWPKEWVVYGVSDKTGSYVYDYATIYTEIGTQIRNVLVDLTDNTSNLEIYAHDEAGDQLTIESMEYNVDGGDWIQITPTVGYGGYEARGFIYANTISPGLHTLQIRAIDQNNSYWPAPDGYLTYEFYGTASTQHTYYIPDSPDFEWNTWEGNWYEFEVDCGEDTSLITLSYDWISGSDPDSIQFILSNPMGTNALVVGGWWYDPNTQHYSLTTEITTFQGQDSCGLWSVWMTGGNGTGGGGTYVDNLTITFSAAPEEDTTPPEIGLYGDVPSGMQPGTISLSGYVHDPESTVGVVSVYLTKYPDVGPFGLPAVPVDGVYDENDEDFTFSYTFPTSGEWTLAIRAMNSSNLESEYSFSFMVDIDNPDMEGSNFGQAQTENTTPSYTGSTWDNTSNIVSVEYNVYRRFPDGTEISWTPAIPDDGAFDSPSEAFHFQINPPLTDGVKSILVRSCDEAGNCNNLGTPGEGFVVDRIEINAVDTTPPSVELQPVQPDPIYDRTPNISGKVGDTKPDKLSAIASISYRLDGGDWIPVTPFDGAFDETVEEFTFDLPELALGDHTVEINASDTSGNSIDSLGWYPSTSFTVKDQDEDVNSIKVSKTSDLLTHTDHDLIGSNNTIWGRNRIRLKQYVTIEDETPITTQHLGPRYAWWYAGYDLNESHCGGVDGLWISKENGLISYYNRETGIEYEYDIESFGVSGELISTWLAEYVTPSGECHLWVMADWQLVGINFGTSITDGVGDSSHVYSGTTPNGAITLVLIDDRDPNNYGLWYQFNGGMRYLRPGEIGTTADDVLVEYDNTADYQTDTITSMFLNTSEGRNELWLANYDDGLVVIDDNGTPLDKSDDQSTTYPVYQQMFDIGIDKNNNIFFAGNWGLFRILDRNGTFTSSDDTIIEQASSSELGVDTVAQVRYLPGDDVIGEQFFTTSRSGLLTYYGTNDTPYDTVDDEVYVLDVTMGRYPTELLDIIMTSENTMTILLERIGVYDVTLHREFADQGIAVTKIYSSLEGDYLFLDHIRLDSVHMVSTLGDYNFVVSNDGGFTWLPITVGETVHFENPLNESHYQLAFGVEMFEGSTPIIDNFVLTYSAYKSPDPATRELNLDVTEEPPTVYTATDFAFNLVAYDELENPFPESEPVDVELRKVSDDSVAPDFNIDNVTISDGLAEISNAHSSVLGLYYIHITNGVESANSDPINFIEIGTTPTPTITATPTTTVTVTPTLTPTPTSAVIDFEISSHYVNLKDDTTAEICWTTNLNAVGNITYGIVNEDNSVSLDKTTSLTPDYKLAQCQTINNLEAASGYTYKIIALSYDGQNDEVTDNFATKGETIPTDVDVNECIVLPDNAYSFETGTVTVKYNTVNNATCTMQYGHDRNNLQYSYSSPESTKNHSSIVDLNKLNGKDPIFIQINCDVNIEKSDEIKQCSIYGSISQTLYKSYYPKKDSERYTEVIKSVSSTGVPILLTTVTITAGALNLLLYPRFILYAIGWLKNRKKVKNWGIVYDEKNRKPVPFASVKLYDSQDKFIQEKVTNFDGKYGFPVSKGKYKLRISHSEYKKSIVDVYIREKDTMVAEDIALGKKTETKNKITTSLKENLRVINTFIVYTGFIFSLFAVVFSPEFYNFAIVGLYILQFLLLTLVRSPRGWGYVFDGLSRNRIQGAFVRLFSGDTQVDVQMTDELGRYGFITKQEQYRIFVDAPGYKFPSTMQKKNILGVSKSGKEFIDVKVKTGKAINISIPLDKAKPIKGLPTPFGE